MKHLALFIALMVPLVALAQSPDAVLPEDREVDMDSPTFVPTERVGKLNHESDSLLYVELNSVYVCPQPVFKTAKQQQAYDRLVYNVKKVLPIAKEVNQMVIETYEYLQTLPNKKARDEHLKRVEADIKRRYTPRMKKLTLTQGKLLIKLIYRECDSSAYDLIRAFINPVRAGFYQAFAWTFGARLNKSYDPQGIDNETVKGVLLVEGGQL